MKLYEIRNEVLSLTPGPIRNVLEQIIDHMDGAMETIRLQQKAIARLEQLVPQVKQAQYELQTLRSLADKQREALCQTKSSSHHPSPSSPSESEREPSSPRSG